MYDERLYNTHETRVLGSSGVQYAVSEAEFLTLLELPYSRAQLAFTRFDTL